MIRREHSRLIVILFVVLLAYLFFLSQQGETFWQDFLPNFFSDLIVGVLVAYLIAYLIDKSKRRDVEIALVLDFRNNEMFITVSISNDGDQSFYSDDIIWHLYLNELIEFSEAIGTVDRWDAPQLIDGIPYTQYSGTLDGSLFPRRSVDLFEMRIAGVRGIDMSDGDYAQELMNLLLNNYFRVSTAHGLIPPEIRPQRGDDIPSENLRRTTLARTD